MSDWFYRGSRVLLHRSVRLYYRRTDVEGREHIPPSGPAILVANHPNSVADAFLLASCLPERKINFIATDSITRAPVLGWLARRFGVVGVARGMDYVSQRDLALRRNEAAIASCMPRLLGGELLAIFGEGISTDARKLHMIRKGAMRFGYAAERAASFHLGLQWIPVGINYSAKERFRSDVLIRVGRPFGLLDLDSDPADHERQVLQRGTERLQRDIESLIVNVEQEELAPLIDRLEELLATTTDSLPVRVERNQRVARAVFYYNVTDPQRLMKVERALHRYERLLGATKLTDEVVRQRHPSRTLWRNLQGAGKHGMLMLLNSYGWANSLVPRWCAVLARPLGRRRAEVSSGPKGQFVVAKEALWATIGGWVGAAVAFPWQIYLVFRWAEEHWGFRVALAVATLYGASLIPAWQLYVRRRDIFRAHLANVRDAARFLLHGTAATRLHLERGAVKRLIRDLLAAYDAAAPRAA